MPDPTPAVDGTYLAALGSIIAAAGGVLAWAARFFVKNRKTVLRAAEMLVAGADSVGSTGADGKPQSLHDIVELIVGDLLAGLRAELAEQRAEIGRLRTELDALRAAADAKDARIRSLMAQLAAKTARVAELEALLTAAGIPFPTPITGGAQ